jgi:hypothetical protein
MLKGRKPSGEKHANSKLNEVVVEEIRKRFMNGTLKFRATAREFGVAHQTIMSVVRGRTWL